MIQPQSALELLQALIRIPSVNPEGDPGTDGVGEAALATYLGEFLRHEGAEVELREVLPGRPNVVARFPTDRPGKPRILFAPHTDTVSVLGMTIPPFGGEFRDGKVWGRGASDTKGPMTSMLWALHSCRAQIPALGYEIWFAGLASEEAGQHGSKALASEEVFDFVIVAEPTKLNVVYTHKGCAFLQLTTKGRACHAAQPHLGENAIIKMLAVLDFLRHEVANEFAAITDPILGSPSLSIGTIQGGSKTNIVPDSSHASIDLRLVPVQFAEGFLEKLSLRLRQVCPDLVIQISAAPPLNNDLAHPIFAQLGECGAQPVGASWFCDACYFAARGTPAVALGPGSIDQAHTRDEFITEEDLLKGVDFFERFLGKL
jgi:hypothetical protein